MSGRVGLRPRSPFPSSVTAVDRAGVHRRWPSLPREACHVSGQPDWDRREAIRTAWQESAEGIVVRGVGRAREAPQRRKARITDRPGRERRMKARTVMGWTTARTTDEPCGRKSGPVRPLRQTPASEACEFCSERASQLVARVRPTGVGSAWATLAAQSFRQPAEPPCTDPYARWCDRESPRGPTYVDSRERTDPVARGFGEILRRSACSGPPQDDRGQSGGLSEQ